MAAPPEKANGQKQTALDRYVAKPDASFKWSVAKVVEKGSVKAHILDMTSQTWRPGDTDKPEWKHWVTVIQPSKVTNDVALLMITGGSNDGRVRDNFDATLGLVAETTGSIIVELRMVPNQPIVYTEDPAKKKRTEDDFIAWTWNKYMLTGDETWPARLPMTKAAVRAMDATTAFLASEEGGKRKIEKFVVTGGSKRGWTTWTTAAVDKRVVGLAPLVIDLLNIVPSFQHHYRAYGFWAPSVGDYYAQGIMDQMNNPKFLELMKIVEPYHYRDRLTQPKLIMNAAGDQFFLPDSWQFYWKDLQGEKHLRYIPNTDHSMRNSDAYQSLMAFHAAVAAGKPRPQYDWKVEADGKIVLTSKDKPSSVKLWQATNPEARDFRLETLGAKYTSTEVSPDANGVYTAKPEAPAKGYTAYFLEMTYPSGITIAPFKFTTGVVVTPNTYPHGLPEPGRTKVGQPPARR